MASSFPARRGPPRAPTERMRWKFCCGQQLPAAPRLWLRCPRDGKGEGPGLSSGQAEPPAGRSQDVEGLCCHPPGIMNGFFPSLLALSPPLLLTWVFFTVCRSASTARGAGLPLDAPREAHVSTSLVIKTKHCAAPPASQLTGQRCSSGLVFPEASAPSGL